MARVAPAIEAAGLATAAELESRRDWFVAPARPAQGARAHDRRHRAPGRARTSATTITYDADAVAKQWKDRAATADILAQARRALEATLPLGAARARGVAARCWPSSSASATRRARSSSRSASRSPGSAASPGIFDVLLVLGRDRSLSRIDDAVEYLRSATDSQRSDENTCCALGFELYISRDTRC